MKHILRCFLLLAPAIVFAQNPQAEINAEIWLPFIRSFSNFETEAFMALHSKNVVRLDVAGGKSSNYEEYHAQQQRGDEYNLKNNRKRSIDLRFEHRSAKDSFAYETGYYRTGSMSAGGGEARYFYGKFNVILKKEQGRWKILLDADHGGVSEAEFWAAAPLENAAAPDLNPADAETKIRAAIAAFSRNLVAGNMDEVAKAYTEDAKIFPPGQEIVHGRAAIHASWAASGKPVFHKLTPSEIKINGTTAYDWGYYEGRSVEADGKESVWKGKYAVVWKETAPGIWKIYLDIWNRTPN